ncbi:uncharacterized protein LOC132299349 [Cornus florida]|uniref:uncharacterized protein LOC132299349 n=1 Tax=Cornus florida TaxID=4283 RepID=UPI0028A0C81C|nr:uncharacterized protein LOC132299349 [Cornus florida]
MNNEHEMATDQEIINRKRKSSEEDDHNHDLQLTLSSSFTPTTPIPPPPPPHFLRSTPMFNATPPPARRNRPILYWRPGKSETVPPPFPWASPRRATVQSLAHLESQQIFTITGEVQCNKCEKSYEIQYDLREKFNEVGGFIVKNKAAMRDRAPNEWLNPVLPICKFCQKQGSNVKPVIVEKKREINWLFLLLGQMIGCCNLTQLKYFCKHTNNHRSGAKDRVLYLTYLGLCKQLQPNGPFDPY